MKSRWAGVIAGFLVAGLPSVAEAIPKELRPGTKANHFEFGPSFGYGFGDGLGFLGSAWLDYRYFFRRRGDGPSLGALTILGGWVNRFNFAIGPLFEWDIIIVPSKPLSVTVGPHVAAGYRVRVRDGDDRHRAFVLFGPTGKLILNDFWVFWVRPLNFDFDLHRDLNGGFGFALGAGISW